MDLGLADKVVALVGGTSGMGYAAAEGLAQEGAALALIGRDPARTTGRARALSEEYGARVRPAVADGRVPGSLDAAITDIVDAYGRLDGLAVTAGPMQRTASFVDLADDDWSDYFETQLMSTVRACRAALPFLQRQGGTVVVTAAHSIRGHKPTLSAYSAMKNGIASVAKNIAKDYGAHGVRCNCIAPGAIATEALDEARAAALARFGDELGPDAALDRFMIEEWHLDVALGRVGRPREVGELIAFLLSERAAYLTGALINIDGGTDF